MRYHVKDNAGLGHDVHGLPADRRRQNHHRRISTFRSSRCRLDGTFTDHIQAGIWVPMDDTHTMVFTPWTKRTVSLRQLKDGCPIPGSVSPMEFLPNGSGWHQTAGGSRPIQTTTT